MSGHGIWFPINLLAGIVVPGITGESVAELEQFQLGALVVAIVVHATFSVTFGLLFGVVSPTLPPFPGGPVIAGGVLMPLLWTGLCHGFMGIINPPLQRHVDWLWFVVSQAVYGLAMSIVVVRTQKVRVPPAGIGPNAPPGSPGPGSRRRSLVSSPPRHSHPFRLIRLRLWPAVIRVPAPLHERM